MNQNLEAKIFSDNKSKYRFAGVTALIAVIANITDVVLGFGDSEVAAYGTKTAVEWFAIFQQSGFKGLYVLGILNIVYQTCLIPVYFALYEIHKRNSEFYPALAFILFLVGLVIYFSNSAAVPMFVLSGKYTAAGTDAQRIIIAAAGEAVLARGEDFTPGSFISLIFGGIAAIIISIVMLRGGIFSKVVSWIGIIGFSLLSIFIILSTFLPKLYFLAFYGFGMLGGLFVLAWFLLVAKKFFQLGKIQN